MEETITISKEEYESLLEDQKLLQCLQDAGVDNWEGYDYAMEMMEDVENTYEEDWTNRKIYEELDL